MKVVYLMLVLLPLAAARDKRFILDNVNSLLSIPDLTKYVNLIVDEVGSDATELRCEMACLDVVTSEQVKAACPFICNSLQSLVNQLHIQPPSKRFILDNVMSLLSAADLAKYVNLIVDQAGSDATEQQCETACLEVMANDLLDTACPFICNSFQSLVQRFHINGQTSKRFILDNVMSLLSAADLAKYVNLIVDQAGSDATEQQCETACLEVMANDLLDTACPFICNSFQSLVQRFHINGQTSKRFILDNVMSLLSAADLAKYVNLIVDQAGSDATEQQCETACLEVMANDLLDTACPFICNSFQSLVQRFHINGQTSKRFILDNVMSLLSAADLAKYVNLIVDQAGSDATEQQCETACLEVMANDLLDTACPFICNSFQSLVQRFHINGQTSKRFILDNVMSLLSAADLAKYVNLIVDQAGSDATEQQCETACLEVMANDLLDTACPFICNSFQSLVQRFHINGQTSKRFILDNVMSLLSAADLAKYVNLIVDQAGSDATEQQCETACLEVMANDLLDTACPFICNSFQSLVQRFHINGQTSKRFILDNVMGLLSTTDLAKYVNQIVDQVGSDATEQQCETACLEVMANDLLDSACPFVCNSFQALVSRFHLNSQPGKRFILDNVMGLLSTTDLAKYVNQIVDQVGSDATEMQCETACLEVMANDLLDSACPFICNSFQALVSRFHLNSQPGKRFILDNVMSLLSTTDLAKYVNQIVDQVGSDATEMQCETACLEVMANDLLDTACPFICNSFQALVSRFHLNSQPGKRFILDNVMGLLSTTDLAKYVNQIVDQVGSDATEQQCETACLEVMANDLLDSACPFVCNSFQALVSRFHLNSQPGKRFILDNVMSLLSTTDLAKYVNQIVDQVGSDATEMQCETACLEVMANDLLDTACPFICNSFQSLVHRFHFGGQPTVAPSKRFLLDNLHLDPTSILNMLGSGQLSTYVNMIVDQVGSDATEQQCEDACNGIMPTNLLGSVCPLVCNSFQAFVHKFHLGA